MTKSSTWDNIVTATAGEYELVRDSSQEEGFGIFSARSTRDKSNVEIRTVPAAFVGGNRAVRESDLAAQRITHPNILPVLRARFSGDTFFWISPAIDGRSLRARLARGGRMDLDDSLTVLRDVSAGLTHAHLHGVVHGGLSPESVIITGGSALVSDLGIPEVFAGLQRRGRRATPVSGAGSEVLRYASPEQAAGSAADARSDVYAWGVIAYEILGGRHPFSGRTTPQQMVAAHADEEPAILSSGTSSAPAGVTRLVMRCLSKDPSKRPESARELFAVMTKEMLVPAPSPAAGTGQKFVVALMVAAVLLIGLIAWLGMRQ